VSYPLNPLGHIPGFHAPGTLNPMVDPAVLDAHIARVRQADAERAIRARLQLMAGRWFAPEHMWVAVEGDIAMVGITDHAARMFGRFLHVSLPEAGTRLAAGDRCGQVEASWAFSDLHAPVGGRVTEVNERLHAEPDLIHDQPFGAGWMFRLAVGPETEASLRPRLLSPAEYEEFTRRAG
jgi:glycine cleavage system H protein